MAFGMARENIGIDPKTGELVEGNTENKDYPSVEGYTLVSDNPFIDGVFVPDDSGPVQITSTGMEYNSFDDSGGRYFLPIGVYSKVSMQDGAKEFVYIDLVVDGYNGQDDKSLCLHADSGITFDLQAVRKSIGFAKIKSFSSVYGVTDTFDTKRNAKVNYYVFVDGEPVLIEKDVSNNDDPRLINVPIEENSRFFNTCLH